MGKIVNISEPWKGYSFEEVETFVKEEIGGINDVLDQILPSSADAGGEDESWQDDNYSSVEGAIKGEFRSIEGKINDAYGDRAVPLTFEASEDGVKVFFNCYDSEEATRTVEVSTDGGTTWRSFTSENYDEEENTPIATLNAGEKALVKGDNEAMGYYSESEGDIMYAGSFRVVGRCYVYGNVMSLLDSQNFRTKKDVAEYAFFSLFVANYGEWSNEDVLSHPAKRLVLPATTLAHKCYAFMFCNCASLVSAPELPATTLADICYYKMFSGCASLVGAPVLPATTLVRSCYGGMFEGCTSLENAPALPATTMVRMCYANMFDGCVSLVNAPALPATTLAERCYYNMFFGCTSLMNAPALPATTLGDYCYYGMFEGCTSLENAPALPATNINSSCYRRMFYGCESLAAAPVLPATYGLVSGCYEQMFTNCTNLSYIKAMFFARPGVDITHEWVKGVSATGTFVKNAAATWTLTGNSGIPTGWTVETATE